MTTARTTTGVMIGLTVAAGIALAGAGNANADTPCTYAPGSLTCVTTNGSFAAAYGPGSFTADGTLIRPPASASLTRDGSSLSGSVTAGNLGASFDANLATKSYDITVTGPKNVTTVSDTLGDGKSPTVTRTPVA